MALVLLIAGTSVMCRSKFPVLFFFTAVHTWVYHSQPCPFPCPFTGPASWNSTGFESVAPIGPGHLRYETYACNDPSVSTVVPASCGRAAVDFLVKAGWDGGWTSPYVLTAGAKNCADVSPAGSCAPHTWGNVCWTFTCNWVDCAPYKLPLACPSKIGQPTQEPQSLLVPGTWTCSPERFSDGKVCDCNCGEWDPDCFNQTLRQTGCTQPMEACIFPGVCHDRNHTLTDRKVLRAVEDNIDVWAIDYQPDFGWYSDRMRQRIIKGWTCPAEYYGSYDGCDSDMGMYVKGFQGCGTTRDPDCPDEPRSWRSDWRIIWNSYGPD